MISTLKSVSDNWSFTQIGGGLANEEGLWIPVSDFPTTVHVELVKLKKIPDPFIGLHEWDVQWVGEADWAFKTTISLSEEDLQAPNADLVLEGLDTFASVELNGHQVLEVDNQFIAHRVAAKHLLKPGPNELVLRFFSAFKRGRDLEKEFGKLNLWNGDSSRLHVRKAQYNYGWDWGPILMTVGPWKPISLRTYQTRITELDARAVVLQGLKAGLKITAVLSDDSPLVASITILRPDHSKQMEETGIDIRTGTLQRDIHFSDGEIDLWYPVGYGNQPIYTVEVNISDENGHVLDSVTQKIAFRRAQVIQEKLVDEPGLTFLFEINEIRIFCGGSNWIPADSFLTTMNPKRYRDWLTLMVEGNQNMVRVWGGGIYEHDSFYDICDELGILVWQDFMFGCGQYPANDTFLKSVEEEAEQAVKRLRHHPSVVIFAGNNEDYQIAESLNLELDYSDETSDFRKTNFPGRHIYERTLPHIVEKHCDIFYHRGSPYSGNGKVTTDRTYGDIHQWNVWHGEQKPWHDWDILSGRFVSEFGMQGYPSIRTVDYWLGGNEAERFPQSRTCCNHNKATGFERRLELYLMENFQHSFEMESYVYYTQIMQAETLGSAYRLWRRNWAGRGKEATAGALVWQLNDCWPVTSWSIVDYFLIPKPAYYAIARELRPFTVGVTRKEKQEFPDGRSAASFTIDTVFEIWGTNSTLADQECMLEVTSFDLHSDWTEKFTTSVVLAKNASTELYKGVIGQLGQRTSLSEVAKVIVVSARLLDSSEVKVLGRHSNWPEPYKYIKFPTMEEVDLRFDIISPGSSDSERTTIEVSSRKPIKGLVLDVDMDGGDEVKWSDQAIDVVPGDPQIVYASRLRGRRIKARYLGDGTA